MINLALVFDPFFSFGIVILTQVIIKENANSAQ
jgi:hypothetical protein